VRSWAAGCVLAPRRAKWYPTTPRTIARRMRIWSTSGPSVRPNPDPVCRPKSLGLFTNLLAAIADEIEHSFLNRAECPFGAALNPKAITEWVAQFKTAVRGPWLVLTAVLALPSRSPWGLPPAIEAWKPPHEPLRATML